MKLKTGELTGFALDWAVGLCEGFTPEAYMRSISIRFNVEGKACLLLAPINRSYVRWSPSFIWGQGGPIIEREKISVIEGMNDEWQAGKRPYKFWYGPQPLIAAMRCYVASKLGDEVEIPEELLK